MRISYKLRIFLLLSLVLVVTSVGWSVWRYASHAEEREAYEATIERLRTQKGQIDSLEAVIGRLREDVQAEKARLEGAGERIGHYERRAVGGRLPTPQYRRYRESIDRHNEIVSRHNATLGRVNALYDEYADLVSRHNTLIDSANAMQRRAVEKGYQLPAAELGVE
ncbi:MAG: hypothetical protein KY397_03165 [Gemmatimonadetes bacterium]|nr:hypothetical protein [Gemmatimonadota bacterium]